jgi:hypothetical protein
MNAKIAKVAIQIDDSIMTFDEWDDSDAALGGGHLKAQKIRFEQLWRVHLFLRREQWEKMQQEGARVYRLFYRAVELLVIGVHKFPMEQEVHDLAEQLSITPGTAYYQKPVTERLAARNASEEEQRYPSEAASLKSLFNV